MKKKKRKIVDDFEDWDNPIYEDDPDNAPRRFKKVPKKYQANFLAKMDKRTEVYQVLNNSFQEIMSDLGGKDNLSHVQVSLCERFCFLEFVLMSIEKQITECKRKQAQALIGRWVQGINSLSGLAKIIGLERRAKKVESLQSYVQKKKKENK